MKQINLHGFHTKKNSAKKKTEPKIIGKRSCFPLIYLDLNDDVNIQGCEIFFLRLVNCGI